MVQSVYFDEAGFTGNNLLDPNQPIFVFASIAMDEELASELRNETLSRSHTNAQELKWSSLRGSERGRKAISWLLSESSEYSRVITADKVYALAGKFFEYIFEPALSERNSLFYAIGFHKYVATLLYLSYRATDPHVARTLTGFVEMMKNVAPSQLDSVLSPLSNFDQSDPLGMVYAFALCHRDSARREIGTGGSDDALRWPLELSMTALHWLLIGVNYICRCASIILAGCPPFEDAVELHRSDSWGRRTPG